MRDPIYPAVCLFFLRLWGKEKIVLKNLKVYLYFHNSHLVFILSRMDVYPQIDKHKKKSQINVGLSPDGSSVLLDGVVGGATGISTPKENMT